jgi:hypothetical protein
MAEKSECDRGGQPDSVITAQLRDGFQCHITALLTGPYVICSSKSAPTRWIIALSLVQMPGTRLAAVGLVRSNAQSGWFNEGWSDALAGGP